MNKLATTTLIVFCGATTLFGDYLDENKKAQALFNSRKTAKALDAFVKLSQGDHTEYQKCHALQNAVQAALNLRKFDEAMKLAKEIPLAPYSQSVQMNVLQTTNKNQELIDQFKDTEITSWPDILIGPSLYYRAIAYVRLKNAKLAESDLTLALTYPMQNNKKARALLLLGDLYFQQLNDSEKALDAYRQVAKFKRKVKANLLLNAILRIVKVLEKQGKYDEAMAELRKCENTIPTGYWKIAFGLAKAAILAGAGKTDAAIAEYSKTLKLEGIRGGQKSVCEKAIEKLKQSTSKQE